MWWIVSSVKNMGRKRQTIQNQQKKREVEAYNLGNRLAERSSKNIEANLLSEYMYICWRVLFMDIKKDRKQTIEWTGLCNW